MAIFNALHVLCMFTGVTLLVGGEVFLTRAIWRRDVRELATVHRLSGGRALIVVGAGFLIGGIVFGFLAALTGGWSLLDGWLLAAYVLVAVLFLVNNSRFAKRLMELGAEAVEAEAGQRPAEEVVRGMADSDAVLILAVNVTLLAAIIADMVVKPF